MMLRVPGIILCLTAACTFDASGLGSEPPVAPVDASRSADDSGIDASPPTALPPDAAASSADAAAPNPIVDASIDANLPECMSDSDYQDHPQNGHRYQVNAENRNWTVALASCVAKGAYLVVIDDMEENEYVRGLHPEDVWIGLHDQGAEGVFTWVNGAPVDFTHFQAREPNNAGNEDCVEMERNGRWSDNKCQTALLAFVCECDADGFPQSPAPTPTRS